MIDNSEVGNESIFVGKSAEARTAKRNNLRATRRKRLSDIVEITKKLKRPATPLVADEAAA
jgi:hypothetical protein